MRCELFDVEVERLTWFSTFTQRSLEEAERVEIAPAAELAPEHRELAEIAAASDEDDRPDVADVLPVDRFCELLDLVPDDALVAIAAEEELAPALRDYWEDVTTSFHDEDAHQLYVKPEALDGALAERAQLRLSSISQDQPHEFRAQAADTAARSLKDAEPELEKLVRGGYRTFVAWARRGEAERAQLNMARMQPAFLDGKPAPEDASLTFAHASLRDGFIAPGLKLAVLPEHRLLRRRRAERPSGPRADRLVHRSPGGLAGGPRGPRHRAVHRLRDEDRRRRDARLPRARVPRRRPRLRAERPAPQDQPLRGRRRRRPAALEARRQAVGADEAEGPPRRPGARRRADQPLRRAQAPRRPRVPDRQRVAARVRGPLPVPRDPRPARGDRGRARGHGGGAPHGPPDLRRRGLRQDRGGAPRRLQGRRGRQAGDVPGPDHGARPAALRHLRGAPARLPVHDRDGLALPLAEDGARVAQGVPGGPRGHPDRHASHALARRAAEGARPSDRRRGAALRREAEGAHAPAAAEGGRALAVGHADPADAPDVARRAARHLGDRDAARGPPAGEDLRRRLRRRPRGEGDQARAGARRPGVLPAQPGGDDRRDRRAGAGARAGRPRAGGARADGRGPAREGDARASCAATRTCSCAPRSSSRGSTSRAPTR